MVIRNHKEFFRFLQAMEALADAAMGRYEEALLRAGGGCRRANALVDQRGRVKRLRDRAEELARKVGKLEDFADFVIAGLPTRRMASVVSQIYLGGSNVGVIAACLGVSDRTIKRDLVDALSYLDARPEGTAVPSSLVSAVPELAATSFS